MFLEHFSLNEQPFGVTPDPRFLYLGTQHREALASLVYGTESNRGFLALIAPPGMGKTSLLFQYLEGLRGKARTAFLFQTDCDSRELLRHILNDLGLHTDGKDLPAMHGMLNRLLEEEMKVGRRLVLVIDEAQNLNEKSLETIRLLSNFETPWAKLMHIVVAGQPELGERLARPSMAQLRQRISLFVRLRPFTSEESSAYIDHRLWVAGYSGPQLITPEARSLLCKHSGGIPRNVNNLCFAAMSLAYAEGARQVDARMVREVVADLELDAAGPTREAVPAYLGSTLLNATRQEQSRKLTRFVPVAATALAAAFLAGMLAMPWNSWRSRPHGQPLKPPVAAATASASTATSSSSTTAETTVVAQANEASRPKPSHPSTSAPVHSTAAQFITITVPPRADLRQLSLQYLGKYDVPTLVEICALNPQIADPSRLQAGQRLRFPVPAPATKEVAAQVAAQKSHEEQP